MLIGHGIFSDELRRVHQLLMYVVHLWHAPLLQQLSDINGSIGMF